MTEDGVPKTHGALDGELTIDVAEELVKASALHAQGKLSDAEFLARRERLLGARPDPESGDR